MPTASAAAETNRRDTERAETGNTPGGYAMLGAGDGLGNQIDHDGPDDLPRKIHAFEERGMGRAPYRLLVIVKGHDLYACDYCATGIYERCYIRDADGRTWVVGNVCVEKTGDEGLIDLVKRARREARNRETDARVEAAKEALNSPGVRAGLQAQPHPNEHLAEGKRTLLDYVNWLLEHAGRSGKVRAAKVIEQAVTARAEGRND